MFYSYSGAQVNPQVRGRDRRAISPEGGRHAVSADDCEESETTV
jgi:hypothetical protein